MVYVVLARVLGLEFRVVYGFIGCLVLGFCRVCGCGVIRTWFDSGRFS